MTSCRHAIGFATVSSLMLGAFLALSPALAASENGKGHGQGGVNGGSNAGGNKASSGSQASASSGGKAFGQAKTGFAARDLGKLNGFFNASPNALRNASASSSIGKISVVYAGLLQSYIDSVGATEGTEAAPSLLDLQNALLDATNKPLSPEIVASINQRLFETNPELGNAATLKSVTSQGLAQEIMAATSLDATAQTTIY